MKRNLILILFVALMAMTSIVSAADGEVTTNGIQILIAPAIGAGIYGALWYYNKTRKEGEAFSWEKFRPTLVMGIIVSLVLFFTGASEITQFTVGALLEEWMPILGNSGIFTFIFSSGLFAVVLGWFDQFVKNFGGSHTTDSAVTPTTTTEPAPVPETPVTQTTLPTSEPVIPKKANRDWLTFDATPENKAHILKQLDEAEAQNLWSFKITFAGGMYIIENGQLIASTGNPSCK